ncbi:cytochrome P450 93A3-like [Papaver somniferum]|uniref:cytochrome P450 93A3-like n=1 Tax=Papaver somniferum TaxID=3469 RepID=UPI000E6FCFAE|nr:cytochrome P450 93A3-like [Papaver somniferum]
MVLILFLYAIVFIFSLLVLLGAIFTSKNRVGCRLPPSPIGLPIIGHMHLIDIVPYRSFHKLAIRYGPLIHLRLGSVPCIIVSSPELAKECLMTNELTFDSRPVTVAIDYLTYNSAGFAFTHFGTVWSFMKKVLMSELLGGQALKKHGHIRRDEIQNLVQLLLKKSIHGETVNVSEELMKLSNNIITQMMLGKKYSDSKERGEEVRSLVREVTEIFGQFNVSDSFGFLRNLDLQGFLKKSTDIRGRYDILLERIIKEREEVRRNKTTGKPTSDVGNNKEKDFLDILLDVSEDMNSEVKLNRDNVKAFLLDIMTAGTDTSAGSTEWALGELINHPNMLQKAREEIDSVVGRNVRLVDESDLPNLPYLQTIFKEALRLHPPAPMLARESTQDCVIGGYSIPAKTRLFVNVWSINRNPKYWSDPLEFRPERFMIPEGVDGKCDQYQTSRVNKDVRGQHFEFLPFGTGRRGCPGIWLSLLVGPAVLAAMIQCLDWEVVSSDGSKEIDMTDRPGLTVPMANPILLDLHTRFDPFNLDM